MERTDESRSNAYMFHILYEAIFYKETNTSSTFCLTHKFLPRSETPACAKAKRYWRRARAAQQLELAGAVQSLLTKACMPRTLSKDAGAAIPQCTAAAAAIS